MKVLLLSRYEDLGASSRVRIYQYIPYLKDEGIDVTIAPLFTNEYIESLYGKGTKKLSIVLAAYFRRLFNLTKIRQYDLLWIEKELFPMLPAWVEEIIARLKIPYIVDYDDAVFHNYDLNKNPIIRVSLRNKIDIVMKNAAVVIGGNDYLAERARKAGARRVEIIPSAVDLKRYSLRSQTKNSVFTIGWIGTPVTAKYLNLVRPALVEVCRGGKGRLLFVGSEQIEFEHVVIEIRSWTEETEVSDIQNFDVGIMPLPDEPWERGKCGYKLIQYMACGKPVIASPVGVNQTIVEHGVNGFLANDTDDWVNALSELRDNVPLREAMGCAGRLKVEKNYCVQVTAPRLAEILRSVAGRI